MAMSRARSRPVSTSGGRAIALLPIETERLLLRRFAADDVAAVLRLGADPWVYAEAAVLGTNRDEATQYLSDQLALKEFELDALFDLAITLSASGEVVGMCDIVRGKTTAEVGFALHSDFRGHGYATETAGALVDLAFEAFSPTEVQAQVAPANRASRAVLERVGMHLVRDGRIETRIAGDLAYAIDREEWQRSHA